MESLWKQGSEIPPREQLTRNIQADVAVIGAGMAGLLTAYELQKRGAKVVVLERERIASGVTADTTAKITAQHGLFCAKLLREMGETAAGQYVRANLRAVERFSEIIGSQNIDCAFERKDSFVYSLDSTEPLSEEIHAAAKLGLPAEFVMETGLPFPVKGAVCVRNQAQFHPLKFLRAISSQLEIYENSPAKEIRGGGVDTGKGSVSARHVVVAAHYPFINVPGFYFVKMYQQRSYVIALENAEEIGGMYIDADNTGYSLRNAEGLLLLGGAGHRSGQNENGGAYAQLRRKAAELYSQARVVREWSAQDCMTLDGIPYIGQYARSTPRLYVATGFGKWGMTSSMAAAMILSARVTGEECEFAPVFHPQRQLGMAAAGNLLRNGAKSVKGLWKGYFGSAKSGLETIEPGHGGIVKSDGMVLGAYRAEDGQLFLVSPKCTHMGCRLEWNPDEKSWDCPCHGSRFRYDGSILDGPAQDPLERY